MTNQEENDALSSIKISWYNYATLPEELKESVPFNLKAIKEVGIPLSFLKEMQNNKEIVIASIKNCSSNFNSTSFELKNDIDVVKHTIEISPWSIEYASESMRNNKDIILECVSKCGSCLEFASERLKADREVVMTAILNKPLSIEFAHSKFYSDEEIILNAVTSDGTALCYADEFLRSNKKIVLAALENTPKALWYINKDLKSEIGKDNPILYIKASLLYEKINTNIKNTNNISQIKIKL